MKKQFLSLSLLAVAISSANAETIAEEPVSEPLTIVVTGTRTSIEESSDTRSITYIEDYTDFEQTPGLNIVQSGPTGQTSSMFFRGLESDHGVIAINGMPVKDHSTISGSDDIGQYSFVGMAGATVVRGPTGSTYGPNAVGGVIDFNSVGTNGSIKTTAGSYGQRGIELSKGFELNNTTYFNIAVGSERADGIDIMGDGDKDGYVKQSANLYAIKSLEFGDVYANIIRTQNESDLDGYNSESTWDFLNQQVGVITENSKLVYNRSTHDRTYDVTTEYSSEETRLFGEHNINDFTLSAERSDQEYGDHKRKQTGMSIAYNTEYFNAEYRIDDTEYGDFSSYRVGATYNNFRSSYANSFRLPSLYEVHGDATWVGESLDVQPEYISSYEIGYGKDGVDVALFYNIESDRITYYSDPVTWMGGYTNNTETDVHTKGMELTVNREVGVFDVAYAYTYTWNDGEKLRRPEHMHDLKLGYQDFYVGANHYGAHTDTDPVTFATIDMDSVTTYSAGWSNGLVNVDLHNLSNEEYQRPAGYNQYGRSITVSLNYEF